MKKRPFQFTIRTMIGVMATTAGVLGTILWLGVETAPFVLTPIGVMAGYLLSRRDALFVPINRFERVAWVVSWGVIGLTVGNVVALSGTELVGLAVFFGVLALLLLCLSLCLIVRDPKNAATHVAAPPGRIRQMVVGTIALIFWVEEFCSALYSGHVLWAWAFAGGILLMITVLIRVVTRGRGATGPKEGNGGNR